MAATTNLSIKIDRDLKTQADALFNAMGMSLTTAVTVFVRQAVQEQAIPFKIHLNGNLHGMALQHTKNAHTQRAAFENFFSAIDKIEDEPVTDEDVKWLENNRVSFRREIGQ